MHLSRANLGLKLNMALLAFFVVFGAATSVVLVYGFNRTQEDATERSEAALAELGSLALSAVVSGAAEQGGLQFESASEIGQRAARHMESFREVGGTIAPIESTRLARTESGLYYDPDPGRTSDLLILGGASPAASQVQEDMAYSASLNAVFDGLFQGFSDDVGGRNFDASAISFLGVSGVTLYYPPIGLHELAAPDADPAPLFERLGPVANPERRTIWREPYEDGAGLGLVITAETPVYEGETFRGVMQVDLLIQQLVDQINIIKPTPRSFAFYVDTSGNLMRSDAFDLLEAESAVNADLATILNAMRDEQAGNETVVERVSFHGEDFFVAHAPMPSIGGSFGVAAPVAEITSEAAAITAGIEGQGARTLLVMLAAMAGLVVVGLIGGSQLNRRVLLNPITRLVAGTQAVAAGELRTELPVRSSDELGQLAEAFNQMTAGLRESERMLEQRVDERTRELTLLLDVSQDVASTLDLQELARLILQQLRAVITYDGAGILLLDGSEVTVLEARDASGTQDLELVGQRSPLPLTGPAGEAVERQAPVIVADAKVDEALAEGSLTVPGRAASGRSWLAAPLITQERVVGVLTLWSTEPDVYGPKHAELALAVASQAAVAIENARLFQQASSIAALEERQRLARELHDSVSQALYGIALGAQTARQLLDTDAPRAIQPVEYVLSLAEAGLAEMRALIFELRPESLASEGLVSAIEKQAAATRARYNLDVVATLTAEPDVPLAVKEVLYRVAQEAMHNAIKHANARRIDLRLTTGVSNLRLDVGDDGVGFEPDGEFPGHLGLRSMRERVRAVDGVLRIDSRPGQGTRISATIPIG